MLGEAKRLERLVGDLLDLARLGAQDFRIDLAPVDLAALVHGAAAGVVDRAARPPASTSALEAPRAAGVDLRPTPLGCVRCWTGCSTTRCG